MKQQATYKYSDKMFPVDQRGWKCNRWLENYTTGHDSLLCLHPSSKAILFLTQTTVDHHHKKRKMVFHQNGPSLQIIFFLSHPKSQTQTCRQTAEDNRFSTHHKPQQLLQCPIAN